MTHIYQVLVCGGTGCEATKANEIYNKLISETKKNGLENDVKIIKTGCFGFCEQGPIIKITPDNVYYVKVSPDDVGEIFTEHLIKGNIVSRLL